MSAMINLLPEVHQNKVKGIKQQRLVKTVTTLVIAISLGVVAVLVIFIQAQKFTIGRLSKEITDKKIEFKATPKIQEMLTVQQHLDSLQSLYGQRVIVTNLFSALSEISPNDITLGSMSVLGDKLTVSGKTKNFAAVNKAVKAWEVGNVSVGPNAKTENLPHVSNVVLTAIGYDGDGKANFTLTADINPEVTRVK